MNKIEQLPIIDAYRQNLRTLDVGIDGYYVQKKYVDPLKQIKQRSYTDPKAGKIKKYETKRGSYLDDEIKAHANIPGPGQYLKKRKNWAQKQQHIKRTGLDRQTYLDDIIKNCKKQKKPAPGHYKLFKNDKDIQAEKKKMASKKITLQDRTTYLDGIQYQSSLLPGVGSYNPRKKFKTETGIKQNRTKPDDWKKKHLEMGKKKIPKTPDMCTYNPLPSEYEDFSSLAKAKHNQSNKVFITKRPRFKTSNDGSGLSPDKYTVIQSWRGKGDKNPKHGLQTISKNLQKNVYYN